MYYGTFVLIFLSIIPLSADAASLGLSIKGVNIAPFVSIALVEQQEVRYKPNHEFCSIGFIKRLASSGVQFVRMVATPLPLMQEMPEARARAIQLLLECGDRFGDRGVAVVYDMHFWSPDNVARQSELFKKSSERERFRVGLTELALALADRKHDSVALELLNEPPRCENDLKLDWQDVQLDLVSEIRKVAPLLPLILTGCGAGADELLALDIEKYKNDNNIYYTFHFYEPFVFTHQYTWSGGIVDFLEYPAKKNLRLEVLTDTIRRITNSGIDADTKRIVIGDILKYTSLGYDKSDLKKRIEKVNVWATENNISPAHVIIGEFGASIGVPTSSASPTVRASEMRWIADVRDLAERFEFKHAYWLYPRPDMFGYDKSMRFLKKELADALDLHMPQNDK